MAIIKEPNKLPGAFAWDGDKNTIPDNNDGQSGLVSIAKGFPNITQIPLEKGGIPPQRADFNGIFNLFSQFLLYLQNGGVFTYSSELDYTPPAIVADTDGNIYKCLKENGASSTNGIKALTETEYWLPILKSETVGGANQLIYLDKGVFKAGRDISDIMSEYLPLTGGTLTGLVQLATSIASNITTNIPLDDSSGKLAPTAWVQAFVSQLSQGLEVTSDDTGHFECPALGITGLMAQNGYIALGKLFGGLIIQWGFILVDTVCTLPLAYKSWSVGIGTFYTSMTNQARATSINQTLTTVKLVANYNNGKANGYYLCVGK